MDRGLKYKSYNYKHFEKQHFQDLELGNEVLDLPPKILPPKFNILNFIKMKTFCFVYVPVKQMKR